MTSPRPSTSKLVYERLQALHHGLRITISVGRSFSRDQDHHSSEADNFPVTSVPETSIPVALQPSRTRASLKSTNFFSSMIRILPGSSLLNIQDYHSSSDDSPMSPSPPPSAAKRGRGNPGTESHSRCGSPQFADSFTSKMRSLPPSFRQHQPNNSPVTTSPHSDEFPRPAFIFQQLTLLILVHFLNILNKTF